MSPTYAPAVLADWIDRVNDEGVNLTDWERNFMESITEQWTERRHLTERQIDILERIYTEKVP